MDITFKGLSLGDDSNYLITHIDGWEDRPETTNGSTPRPRRLGSWAGGLSSVKRVISIDLEILPDRSDNLTTLPKYNLSRALAMDDAESPLMIDLGYGIEREQAFVRCTAFSMPTNKGYGRRQTASLEFTATDPRRYSIQTNSARSGFPVALRGTLYPISYGPYAQVITPGSNGESVVQNIGNAPTPGSYRIVGPVSNPIVNISGPKGYKRRIQFRVTLAAGEVLTADSATDVIMVGRTVRRGITTGALLADMELPPGTSTVKVTGGGDGSGTHTVSWRDANL